MVTRKCCQTSKCLKILWPGLYIFCQMHLNLIFQGVTCNDVHHSQPVGTLTKNKIKSTQQLTWKNILHFSFLNINNGLKLKQGSSEALIGPWQPPMMELLAKIITLSRRRSLSYKNQSTDLQSKSMDWFLYDRDLRHERVQLNKCFFKKTP